MAEFPPPDTKITRQASNLELLAGGAPIVETYTIDRVMYNRHVGKTSGKASIKVSYLCGLNRFTEFVTFDAEHPMAIHRSREWWRQRHATEPPLSTDQALVKIMECRTPRRLRVWVNKEHPQVLGVEF